MAGIFPPCECTEGMQKLKSNGIPDRHLKAWPLRWRPFLYARRFDGYDKITIFTSHRLSNVVLANRIIVLENGKIVEDGTHESLLKNNKRYSELFRYKNEKYKLPQ